MLEAPSSSKKAPLSVQTKQKKKAKKPSGCDSEAESSGHGDEEDANDTT